VMRDRVSGAVEDASRELDLSAESDARSELAEGPFRKAGDVAVGAVAEMAARRRS